MFFGILMFRFMNKSINITFDFFLLMDVEKIILRKLFRRRVIGGKHTAIENLTKGLPKHKIGDAKKAVDNLIKKNFILSKHTSYGLHVSLNPEKIEKIYSLLGI